MVRCIKNQLMDCFHIHTPEFHYHITKILFFSWFYHKEKIQQILNLFILSIEHFFLKFHIILGLLFILTAAIRLRTLNVHKCTRTTNGQESNQAPVEQIIQRSGLHHLVPRTKLCYGSHIIFIGSIFKHLVELTDFSLTYIMYPYHRVYTYIFYFIRSYNNRSGQI